MALTTDQIQIAVERLQLIHNFLQLSWQQAQVLRIQQEGSGQTLLEQNNDTGKRLFREIFETYRTAISGTLAKGLTAPADPPLTHEQATVIYNGTQDLIQEIGAALLQLQRLQTTKIDGADIPPAMKASWDAKAMTTLQGLSAKIAALIG